MTESRDAKNNAPQAFYSGLKASFEMRAFSVRQGIDIPPPSVRPMGYRPEQSGAASGFPVGKLFFDRKSNQKNLTDGLTD